MEVHTMTNWAALFRPVDLLIAFSSLFFFPSLHTSPHLQPHLPPPTLLSTSRLDKNRRPYHIMIYFKTSLALLGAVALLVAPATAQYGRDEEEAAAKDDKGESVWDTIKSFVIGAESHPASFGEDPTGAILNLTDATYKDIIFQGEHIITL